MDMNSFFIGLNLGVFLWCLSDFIRFRRTSDVVIMIGAILVMFWLWK